MGYRFWRRIPLAKGVTLNLSKGGVSLSFGRRGFRYTIGRRGRRTTLGIPGTGLFYTLTSSRKGEERQEEAIVPLKDRLTLGFFQRLFTSKEEQAFVDGCRALVLGRDEEALAHLKEASHYADGAYLAGFLALKQGNLAEGEKYLTLVLDNYEALNKLFSKYGFHPVLELAIAEEVSVYLGVDYEGALLGLVEIFQLQKRWEEAIVAFEKLLELQPEDPVVKLSLAELLMDAYPGDKKTYEKIVNLLQDVENETPIHTALLLYKARALKGLKLYDAAVETLKLALRRKKDRPEELRKTLLYERACLYETLGEKRKARKDFEKLYAQDPSFEDVAEKLGLTSS